MSLSKLHQQWLHYCLMVSKKGPLFSFLCDFFPFMGGSIIKQLCPQDSRPLWSAQITDHAQGMEMDGLYGLGSECVYWVDKMTGFSLLSLAFALLSLPHWIQLGFLLSLSPSYILALIFCVSAHFSHILTFIFYTSLVSLLLVHPSLYLSSSLCFLSVFLARWGDQRAVVSIVTFYLGIAPNGQMCS